MIEPDYLSFLRGKHNAQDILLLVQLEQIIPGWWQSQPELAKQLGLEPHSTGMALRRLHKRKLIEMTPYGKGGTFIWWIKRSASDKPLLSQAPSWRVKDIKTGKIEDVFIHERRAWAERNNLNYNSFRVFLYGYRKIMAGRYKLISTPIDKYSTAS